MKGTKWLLRRPRSWFKLNGIDQTSIHLNRLSWSTSKDNLWSQQRHPYLSHCTDFRKRWLISWMPSHCISMELCLRDGANLVLSIWMTLWRTPSSKSITTGNLESKNSAMEFSKDSLTKMTLNKASPDFNSHPESSQTTFMRASTRMACTMVWADTFGQMALITSANGKMAAKKVWVKRSLRWSSEIV